MPCKLCGAPDHRPAHVAPLPNSNPLLDCPLYARVPQPMKDAIRDLWNRNPQAVSADKLSNWIYETIYSPGAAQGGAWTFFYSPHYSNPVGLIDERIYMAVKGTSLLKVWNALMPLFQDSDIVQAKHCPPNIADQRPDSLVIYLRNKAGVWRTCDKIRALRHNGAIADTDFRNAAPPGTGRIDDLPGVATAPQPDDPGESYGGRLSDSLAKVFNARNRPQRIPEWDFMAAALKGMKDDGFNIAQPWIRPRQT